MVDTEKVCAFKVSETLPKDVGRGLVRLDPADMAAAGVAIGDFVEICGKKNTVAKVMPAFKDQRGQSRVQIDGLTRENAGTALEQMVEIRKVATRPADKVVLSPVSITLRERDLKYIGSLLDGLPVIAGDRRRSDPGQAVRNAYRRIPRDQHCSQWSRGD